jgi:hypothetical protein
MASSRCALAVMLLAASTVPPACGQLSNASLEPLPTAHHKSYKSSSGTARRCPLPGYCQRPAGLPGPEQYQGPAAHPGILHQRRSLTEYLAGPAFTTRAANLAALPEQRGILVSAGKPHHVGGLTVMLHVLRHHLNCTLPLEVAHRGDGEVKLC